MKIAAPRDNGTAEIPNYGKNYSQVGGFSY
jgi:hypothetical protein